MKQHGRILGITVTEDRLSVDVSGGAAVSVPLTNYPRLLHGNGAERNHWRLIGSGEGIRWPELDEDLSIESLIAGSPSGESSESLKRWIEERKSAGRPKK